MSTIRVSDEVKERLRDLKRDDESFNDLLDRLSRSEKDVEAIAESLGELDDGNTVERMDDAHEELNESLEKRADR
jgi:predicted CopG family antitoxin